MMQAVNFYSQKQDFPAIIGNPVASVRNVERNQILQAWRFSVERIFYRTASGTAVVKDVVRHPGSVALVPVLDDGSICLIRNYRVSVDQPLIEIPAGTLEPPEPPLECARRELIEETGFRGETFELLTTFFAAPGIMDEQMHLYRVTGLTAGEPQRESGEEIENLIVTADQAIGMVKDGTICDAKTIVGLLWATGQR